MAKILFTHKRDILVVALGRPFHARSLRSATKLIFLLINLHPKFASPTTPCPLLFTGFQTWIFKSMGENAFHGRTRSLKPIQKIHHGKRRFVSVKRLRSERTDGRKEFESQAKQPKSFYARPHALGAADFIHVAADAFPPLAICVHGPQKVVLAFEAGLPNKEGFRKLSLVEAENRKPLERLNQGEGCKAHDCGKERKDREIGLLSRFVKEHNHQLVPIPVNGRRSMLLSQTPAEVVQPHAVCKLPLIKWAEWDEKDVKIRELTAELQRERKRSAAIQEQLDMVLREMEEHSNHLSRNIDDIVQSLREIESNPVALFKRQ
ncbi:hypothetical protein GOBAR_DD05075 [Gossypium barbadense]|nr:hypothetical protein GOBAR_DD05075 [Gossypium barbadense]